MPRRAITWALCAAVIAVAVTVVLVERLTRDDAEYDTFVELDEPGFFTEPADVGNPDVTGTALPQVTFEDHDGTARTLDEFRGTPLVVNLWYKNCPPCARELGDFAAVDTELQAAGVAVQFIGLNPMDSAETMVEFATDRGVQYELWRDTERNFGVEIGAVLYPVTLYVDADGRVIKQTGETNADELRATIADLFGVTA